jgi:hypothetical protein
LAKPGSRWTVFVAGLWSARPIPKIPIPDIRPALLNVMRRAALAAMLAALPGCSEIALSNGAIPPGMQPPYVSLATKYLQSTLKDVRSFDGFEISPPRWVNTVKGWNWLTCVRFRDHGHTRIYAIFIQENVVSDARYAVGTDACEAQTYTQFDLVSGELGRPTAPVQQPLY